MCPKLSKKWGEQSGFSTCFHTTEVRARCPVLCLASRANSLGLGASEARRCVEKSADRTLVHKLAIDAYSLPQAQSNYSLLGDDDCSSSSFTTLCRIVAGRSAFGLDPSRALGNVRDWRTTWVVETLKMLEIADVRSCHDGHSLKALAKAARQQRWIDGMCSLLRRQPTAHEVKLHTECPAWRF